MVNLWSLKDLQEGKIQFPEKNANSIHFKVNTSAIESLTLGAGRSLKYSWQEKEFKLYTEKGVMTFADAEAFCVNLGGHLASIGSEKENVELLKEAGNHKVWLGGTDQVEEGIWIWSDGKVWNFTYWATGKPDNVNNSDCMFIANWDDLAFWHDIPCAVLSLWP